MPPAPVQTRATLTGATPPSSHCAAVLGLALAEHRDVTRAGVSLERLVCGCALAVLLIGLLVLAGWVLQIEALKSLLPGLASMKPNTALGFVLAGLALAQRQHRSLRLGCAVVLCLLGGLSLTQDLADLDFGTDQWLLPEAPGAAQTVHPGRMSIITAINFMLCGTALLLLGSRRTVLRRTMETLALLAGAAALLALIGYAYGTEALYRLPGFGSIAGHTALAFMLLAIGLLGSRADGLAGIFASADLGGQVARRFLPLALLTPLLLGALAQLGEHAGLVNSTQKTAAYAATMVLVLAVLTWRNALLLQHSDAERQQAEAQLREREALLATLTGRARVGMVMVTAERRYAFANSAYAEVLGLPITDIVGRRVPDVLAPVYDSQVRPRLDRAFAGESVSYDLRLPPLAHGAGERHFAITYDPPVETVHGPCVIVLVVDVTERTRAEEQLRASEERMRLAAKAAQFGMYDRDLRGTEFHASAQLKQMLGYDADAPFDRQQAMAHFHPDDRAVGVAAFERACDPAGDGRIAIEQRIVRRDGVVRWIASVGQVLFKDGVPERSLGFWVDITAAKEAEELRLARDEAQRAAAEMALTSKYKSEFLANMSHELRTPLNSLLILAQMLADNKPGNLSAKQVEFAKTIYQSGQDLLRLINEILDLSRIEAGQMVMHVEPVALAGLAEKIERDFRHVAQSKRLDFSVRLDAQLPALIRSDTARIEQVLKNLLANSFKFTNQGGVRLSIRRATDGWSRPHPGLDRAASVVAFAVSDSGIGIAPDKQLLIFEAFAQVDGTTSRKYGGTGLGLTISRELASLLGGAITLTSQPGVGSTFTLYLPDNCSGMPAATPEAAAAPQARAATAPAPLERPHGSMQTLSGKTVLVVDDDIRNVFALFAILESAGIAASHAENGQQCLDLLQAGANFDAVLMDIMMPGMDGYETLRRLRALPHLADLPIIALTAKAMKGDREKCLAAGASDYLAKPVNAEQLLALLRQWTEP
ncbi:MAG: Family ership [Pseudomonadota bacterium]|jgi:PAS domain S-box-containing protein